MKPLLPTSSGKNIQGVILVEGSSVVSDPGFVVEVFSDYFAWKPARLTPVFKQGIDIVFLCKSSPGISLVVI